MKYTLLAGLVSVLSLSSRVSAQEGSYNLVGCYSNSNGLADLGTDIYQTSANCYKDCSAKGGKVFATHNGNECYCGDSLPSGSQGGNCNIPCVAYPNEMCGGSSAWSFYTIGNSVPQPSASSAAPSTSSTASSSSSSSSTPSSTSTTPSSSSTPGSSTSSNAPSTTSASPSSTSTGSGAGGSKKSSGIGGGAIAGIVIGVIAAVAAIGAVAVFLKRRRDSDEGWNPSSSPNGFGDPFSSREDKNPFGAGATASTFGTPMAGSQQQNSNSSFVAIDQRLNPVMLGERRISDGSLADEQDYSRKILRVTNPDNQ